MLYLNFGVGLVGIINGLYLTLTNVVFECIRHDILQLRYLYLTLTNVVFEFMQSCV